MNGPGNRGPSVPSPTGPCPPSIRDDSFREAMAGVEPLDAGRLPNEHRAAPTPGQQRRRDAAVAADLEPDPNDLHLGEVTQMDPHERFEWKKDGVQPAVFHKLKTGGYTIEGQLDLHSRTVEQAREDVYRFLGVCRGRGWRCVVIAHGRGERSPTPARMKSYVAHWMRQVPDVIACSSAPAYLGGTGAVLLLLRKTAARKEENRERHGFKSDHGVGD